MDEETIKEFVEAGITFWQSVENPTTDDLDILFTAIVNRDHGELEELFDRYKIRKPWAED